MIWTHIYDLLLKLLTLFACIVLLIQVPNLEDHGVMLLLIVLLTWFVAYHFAVRTLATYLYCRLTLRMDIHLKQAKQLNNAFSPSLPRSMKWLPMKELRHLDSPDKFSIALKMYQHWAAEDKHTRAK